MRFKLPDTVSAASVGGHQFTADDNGFIDVPDDLPAELLAELRDVVGAKPFAPEHAAAMRAEEVEREALHAHLAELGIAADRRRRYPLDMLRGLRDDAVAARDEAAATAATATSAAAPSTDPGPGGDAESGQGGRASEGEGGAADAARQGGETPGTPPSGATETKPAGGKPGKTPKPAAAPK